MSCNSCHSVIDPLGFSENFDVIGGWRTTDESGNPIDATGSTTSGEEIEGLRTAPPAARTRVSSDRDRKTARVSDGGSNTTSCNSCHSVIDPLGFSLENFDVIGGWRTTDESGNPIDATGSTTSGEEIEGLAGLRRLLLERPEQFPRTVTEKLLAYALGRRLEYYDRPAVRQIVRTAAADDYSWSSLIVGVVNSPTFRMSTL